MKILTLNCGSSTLKFQLIDTDTESVLVKDNLERITDHRDAVAEMFKILGKQEIHAIGHRVVHGGEKYSQPVIATEEILECVESVSHFAPLHNPKNLLGVRACMELLPDVPNILVFDTAFHATLPPSSYLYAIPWEDYEKHGIRRYGFHGTSYSYVSRTVAEMLGKPLEEVKMVVAHLGNGASVCAINGGRSVETSMGMTPLEGLEMGTRSGDIDAGAVAQIARVHNMDIDETVAYLNNKSGLQGISGISDMRDLRTAANEGNERAKAALDVFVHRLTKYIGGYVAILGGADAIVFTGGIGTNDCVLRAEVMKSFAHVGANIDDTLNKKYSNKHGTRNGTGEITASGSKMRTFVVCTNEELEIATQVRNVLEQ